MQMVSVEKLTGIRRGVCVIDSKNTLPHIPGNQVVRLELYFTLAHYTRAFLLDRQMDRQMQQRGTCRIRVHN